MPHNNKYNRHQHRNNIIATCDQDSPLPLEYLTSIADTTTTVIELVDNACYHPKKYDTNTFRSIMTLFDSGTEDDPEDDELQNTIIKNLFKNRSAQVFSTLITAHTQLRRLIKGSKPHYKELFKTETLNDEIIEAAQTIIERAIQTVLKENLQKQIAQAKRLLNLSTRQRKQRSENVPPEQHNTKRAPH